MDGTAFTPEERVDYAENTILTDKLGAHTEPF